MTDITAFETDPDKLVEEAKGWAIALWRSAGRQSGNSQRAMYRAAGWAKVPPNTLWKLRYRPPRDLGVSIYNRLRVAYVERVEALEGKVAENLAALRELPSTKANQRLIAEMEKFLGLAEGDTSRVHPAHLSGSDPHGGAVPDVDDGVRLDMFRNGFGQ